MNYLASRHIVSGIAAAVGALAFFVAMGACTRVDDRLGADLVPVNQKMKIEVSGQDAGVKTYLFREDSIPSSRTGYGYFGRRIDPNGVFGAQSSSFVVQFQPASVPYDDAEGYGLDPIVDSALILLTLSDVRGDTTQLQRFDVWDIAGGQEPLTRDTTYYTNFPIDRYKGQKLFEFTQKGRRDIVARLFPTAAGKKYLDSLVRLRDWDEYIDDSLFRLKFQGLYITPAEGSPDRAALYGADLSASGLQLFVRNHDTLDVTAIYDTVSTIFTFRDTDQPATYTSKGTKWNNVSVNMSAFDYTGSVLGELELSTGGFTDTLPTSPTRPTLYVQSMGGVGTLLRFTDELVETIRNLGTGADRAGRSADGDIFINQATMRIWLTDPSTAALDGSVKRLGSYLDMKTLTPIPDYQYANEVYQNQLLVMQNYSPTYALDYGGYLNRSNAYYEFDITSYIQQLSKVKDDDPDHMYVPSAVFIGPEAYGIVGSGESTLKGFDSDRPVSIRITYTIIDSNKAWAGI